MIERLCRGCSMVRKLLYFLLVASIIACPLWCRNATCASADGCCRSNGGATECCSQERCPGNLEGHVEHRTDDSQPNDNSPQGVCQCICGGAINDQSGDSLAPPACSKLDVAAAANDLIAATGFRQCSHAAISADWRALPRCNLFILNMAMLL